MAVTEVGTVADELYGRLLLELKKVKNWRTKLEGHNQGGKFLLLGMTAGRNGDSLPKVTEDSSTNIELYTIVHDLMSSISNGKKSAKKYVKWCTAQVSEHVIVQLECLSPAPHAPRPGQLQFHTHLWLVQTAHASGEHGVVLHHEGFLRAHLHRRRFPLQRARLLREEANPQVQWEAECTRFAEPQRR
jgi:hypothetical protein